MTRPISLLALCVVSLAAAAMADTAPPASSQPNLRMTNEVRIYQLDKDAVVNISSTRIVNAAVATGDPVFDRFFGGQMRAVPTASLGSGFIVHAAGYIVTNEHVVDQATDVHVTLSDGTKLAAQVLATDSEHDLAVIKVSPPKDRTLQAIALGSSEDLMIGEPVYAIGNPFGYSGSMTRGIISATDRTLEFGPNRTYKGLIQTDASINPGNSGGPLLNAYGQLIGINTAIRAEAHGIGFAISVSTLRDLLPGFLNTEVLHRSQVGFSIEEKRTLTPPAAVAAVVRVKEVTPPATKAGLEKGDVLVAINGVSVGNVIDAAVALAQSKAGDTVGLRVTRAGKAVEVKVPVTAAPPPESELILATKLGVQGKTVSPAIAQREGLAVANGLLLTKVDPEGPAGKAGLKTGDVIVQLGRYYVNNLEDVALLLKSVKKEVDVRIGVVRGNQTGRAVIKIK